MLFSLLVGEVREILHTDCTALHLDCNLPAQGSHISTITKLPLGKYRAHVRPYELWRAVQDEEGQPRDEQQSPQDNIFAYCLCERERGTLGLITLETCLAQHIAIAV